ncbi:MAG: DUF4867 family protein [Velocimicrobium sp.]
MTFEQVKEGNANKKIYKVTDDAFKCFGKVYDYDTKELIEYATKNIEVPKIGDFYQASDAGLESIAVVQTISEDLFGGLIVQAGPCTGHNQALTGFEYHQGSEVVIAVTDCVLILGKRENMEGNTYQGEKAELFYVKKGQVVELYGTTLHYTPCKVDDFFMTVVLLLKGTNEALDKPIGICRKKNKYFIAHSSQTEKIKVGNYPGLLGELIFIQ